MIKNFYKKGFTLVEMLLVIAIIMIIVAVATPQLLRMRNLQIIKGSGEDVLAVFNKAHSETLASLNSLQYGVHLQSDKIIMFSGTVYNSNNASNEIIKIVSPATISSISLANGGSDIYFSRLSGTASTTGTIVVSISSNASLAKTITISATGGVSMN